MTANPLIPLASQTRLPGGDFRAPDGTVVGPAASAPQVGAQVTPRTPGGSGAYGAPGSIQPAMATPVRDYVVILKNESDRDFRMRYLTVEYLITAHDQLVVPWEVMVSFLGSPETLNLGPRRMDRKNAYDKLRVKYGAYYDDQLWEENKPRLTAWRVTGERLVTIVDDPDGLSVTTSAVTQQEQIAATVAMEQMQKQLAALQSLVAQMSGQSQSQGQQFIPESDMGQVPTNAPEAPDFVPGGISPGPILDPQAVQSNPLAPPPPVPGMTPQMPVTGAQAGAQTGVQPVHAPASVIHSTKDPHDDSVENVSSGATPDTPANTVRVG